MSEKAMQYVIARLEKKLKEYMTEEDHAAFCREISKEAFRIDIDGMEDCDFKDFVLANFDIITGGDGNAPE